MLETCIKLEMVLKHILNAISAEQTGSLPGLLAECDTLTGRILKDQPDRDRLSEIGNILASIISLEQAIICSAREKRAGLIEDMKELRRERQAAIAYGVQSLKGVRP